MVGSGEWIEFMAVVTVAVDAGVVLENTKGTESQDTIYSIGRSTH